MVLDTFLVNFYPYPPTSRIKIIIIIIIIIVGPTT